MLVSADQASSFSPAPSQAPDIEARRSIVLLSDGTGNSAAKLGKTNVWRLYQALELGDGTQLAFYDDGVGTSGFKFMRILGGAFGFGLARNVRDLYRSLCQHYRPCGDDYAGDRIYIFGFSRGAFTARILADLICSCGILNRGKHITASGFLGTKRQKLRLDTERGLKVGVKIAYKAYRRKYQAPLFAPVFRRIRDLFFEPIPEVKDFRADYSHGGDKPTKPGAKLIEAVGVWDTVAAYGLPNAKLADFIDRLFYKLHLSGYDLDPQVGRAFHALAIDDERESFHPLLWDESKETCPDRIQQVWFPGMHSDVGGGYADGDLSLLSLNWMIRALQRRPGEDAGLVFTPRSLEEMEGRIAATAQMHDSRSGFAMYYRYKPRLIEDIRTDCKPPIFEKAKIHECVFARIRHGTQGYSPRVLPNSYDVVGEDGNLLPAVSYETRKEQEQRDSCQKKARKYVSQRQRNYNVMLAVTFALVLMPFYEKFVPRVELSSLSQVLDWILKPITIMLPQSLEIITEAWTRSPILFLVIVAILVLAVLNARRLARHIIALAEEGWGPVKQRSNEQFDPSGGVSVIRKRR